MDQAGYMKHNRIPNLFAEKFISEVASTTGWKDEPLDTVMDIGCGPGNISTYWIDHYFPNIRRLIGIDMDPVMINLAKKQNKKENIHYQVADIMERSGEWEGGVSRIFSNFALHRVSDQKHAFRNIFRLLEPEGEAAVHLIVEGPFYSAFRDLLNTPKWRPVLEPTNFIFPEAFIKKYDADHYKRMFEDIGFGISSCEMKTTVFPYESDEECKNLLMSLHSIGEVSDQLKEEYKKDMFDQYMKHGYRNSEGRPVHNLVILQAVLKKNSFRVKGGSYRHCNL